MKSYYVLLAVVLALAGSTTSAMATEAKLSIENSKGGRMLRAQTTDEERHPLSFVSAKMRDIKMTNQAKNYAKTETNDNYVKQKFGLPENVPDDTLKTMKNYKYYEVYLTNQSKFKMDTWIRLGIPTTDVWKTQGLHKMDAASRKKSDKYDKYAAFLQRYDDAGIRFLQRRKRLPDAMSFGGSDAEKLAKIDIWVAQGRPERYVKALLKNGVEEGTNQRYLDMYLEGVKNLKKLEAAA